MAVIDVISQDPGEGEFALHIAYRDWTDAELPELQDKLNDYLSFALDGPMAEMYPHTAGKPVRIQIDLYRPPTGLLADFLARAASAVEREGLRLAVNAAPRPGRTRGLEPPG